MSLNRRKSISHNDLAQMWDRQRTTLEELASSKLSKWQKAPSNQELACYIETHVNGSKKEFKTAIATDFTSNTTSSELKKKGSEAAGKLCTVDHSQLLRAVLNKELKSSRAGYGSGTVSACQSPQLSRKLHHESQSKAHGSMERLSRRVFKRSDTATAETDAGSYRSSPFGSDSSLDTQGSYETNEPNCSSHFKHAMTDLYLDDDSAEEKDA